MIIKKLCFLRDWKSLISKLKVLTEGGLSDPISLFLETYLNEKQFLLLKWDKIKFKCLLVWVV